MFLKVDNVDNCLSHLQVNVHVLVIIRQTHRI